VFVLDTVMSVIIKEEKGTDANKIFSHLLNEIKRLDNIFNVHKENSEISRINQSAYKKPSSMSLDFKYVLLKSIYFHNITYGKFNSTMLSLKNIWNFSSTSSFVLPDKNQINAALQDIGHKYLKISKNYIQITKKGVGIELGGIAKGYIIDRLTGILKSSGIKHALLNIGGDVFALGRKGIRKWRIGIQHPRKSKNSIYKILNVENKSVVTSGDYERYVVIKGKRYHHIIDPETGMPSDKSVSATVIADDAITADALSTAIFILDPKSGIKLIEKLKGVEALILYKSKNRLKEAYTKGFLKYISNH
jgi:thiamine biosynthesis lipoprotein